MSVKDKPRLGRGLDALFGNAVLEEAASAAGSTVVAIERIEHNPYQPRKNFDEEELSGLSESIRTHGVLQPLVVRAVGDRYQLVAGERRLRAAQAAGFTEVPVRVLDFNDQEVLEAALVENIQRSDLNPIEKAQGFKEHLDRFGLTQEQLASRLGLDRTTISNLVGLLDLPAPVQEAVRLGQISTGHAKILKGMKEAERQVVLCKEIIARGYSVRALENLLKESRTDAREERHSDVPEKTAHVQAIEDELCRLLATKVEIRVRGKDRGQIVLAFESNDDFERLIDKLRE